MKHFMSFKEASAELAARGMTIAVGTLRKWKTSSKILVKKIGGRVFVPASEIERLIERKTERRRGNQDKWDHSPTKLDRSRWTPT